MVRVVSQNFSPPRSRHSSGETDRDLAERANLALSVLGRKRVDGPDYESSSDSFWDSELDGDQGDTQMSENGEASNDINGNESLEKSDVQSKRKERRRERNKLSAQAYRQRRRTQNVKEQQTLMELEAENKRLHKLVETLEKKTEHAKHMLRGCYLPKSELLQPIGEVDGATADMTDTEPDLATLRPNVPLSSQSHIASSSHAPLNFSSYSDTCPATLPRPKFLQKFSPGSAKKESHPSDHIQEKDKVHTFTYPATFQATPAVSPTLPSGQIILNTNVLIGASLSPSGTTNLTAVPALLTIPIKNEKSCYPNSNLNCNPLRTCPTSIQSPAYPDSETRSTSAADGTVWWNSTEIKPTLGPMASTLVGFVSMDVCSNDNMNNSNMSVDDANGNASCDKNFSMKFNPNSQPVSFNLNLNQAAGAAGQGTLCQEHCQTKHPSVSVQYFLTPADQVSVQ